MEHEAGLQVDDLQRLMALATEDEVTLELLRGGGGRKTARARRRPRIGPVAA
ncbi:hypothetical protein [Corallococcus macrosporus]|uniref:Peptidase S1 n=1 Tax=Corallococcus macrosporus DSM 14697 TaxID=1189310 RepID=A0A250JM94_9BACT|nr:hypothetical protein [Corallococcus macrosporus]ATB44750.1 peptidase S1 [Corallococcus macrosporus DSM 14697]